MTTAKATSRHSDSVPAAAASRNAPRGAPGGARRWLVAAVVAVAAGGVGYGLSLLLGGCTTCATGSRPIALGVLFAVVAGWSALSAKS